MISEMGIDLSVVLGVSLCVCLSLVFFLSCLHLAADLSRKLVKVGQVCAVSEHFSLSSASIWVSLAQCTDLFLTKGLIVRELSPSATCFFDLLFPSQFKFPL